MADIKKEMPLNIAIVCDGVTDCVAGSFVSTLRFSERLVKRGHKVVFIASRTKKRPKDDYYDGIKVYRFRSILVPKSEGQLYMSFPTKKEIHDVLLKEKIDVVHTMIMTPNVYTAIKVARQMHLPIVAHSHTQPENIFMHVPLKALHPFLNKHFYHFLSWLYGMADALVFPSMLEKKLLYQLEVKIETRVISNGVDTAVFKKGESEPLRQKWHIDPTTKKIVYVGRLHPEKSLETLVRAMPLVLEKEPLAHCYLAGFGHMQSSLEALAGKLGVRERITFFGKVSNEELVMAFNIADVFVLPSLAELEGMVVLEAMACGKPVVVANAENSASTAFVKDNGALFAPEDSADLAEKLVTILQNDDMRREMGERSLEQSALYSIDESVSQLETLYREVIALHT